MKVFERIFERQPLTDEERMLVEIVRELVRDRIAPRADEYDRQEAFPGTTCAISMSSASMVCSSHGSTAELSSRTAVT